MQAEVVSMRRNRGIGLLLAALVPWVALGCEGDEGEKGDQGPPGDPTSGEEPTELSPEEDPPGIVVEILSVDGASGSGGSWQVDDFVSVTFSVTKDDGEDWASLSEFSSGRALLSGPTSNYNRVLPEVNDVRDASVQNPDGSWTYTFADAIPALYEPPLNDSALQAHGVNRKGVGLCLLCHTSGAEDAVSLVAGGTPTASIDFRVMIHRIHNGAHLPSVLGVGTPGDGSRSYAEIPEPYQIIGNNDRATPSSSSPTT